MERLSPLEERIRDELLARITRHETDPQGRLPSEAQLAKEFGASRATVRAALSLLAAQGIVVRKHGSGTYVDFAMLQLRLKVSDQWEFSDLLRAEGYEPGLIYLDHRVEQADAEVAAALDVKVGEETVVIRKVFTADARPAMFSINILPLRIAHLPQDGTKLQGPIFPYLEETYGQAPAYSVADVRPVLATDELAALLAVEPRSPLLLMKGVYFDKDNQPMMYAYNYYTDIIHFKAIRQPNSNWI